MSTIKVSVIVDGVTLEKELEVPVSRIFHYEPWHIIIKQIWEEYGDIKDEVSDL